MSRLTGKDALGLFEAYNAVYNPDIRLELEEELILQENAELWVSECIGEGVDFSEYTLDELTEAFLVDCGYLTEDAAGRAGLNFGAGARQMFGQARRAVGSAVSNVAKGAVNTAGAVAQGLAGQKGGTGNVSRTANALARGATAPQRFAARAVQGFVTGQGSGPSKPAKPAAAKPAKPAAAKPAPSAAAKPSSAPAARPASAARPSAAPAAKPAAAKPAPTPAATPSAKVEPSKPVPRQKDTSITDMIGRSQVRQGAPINTGNKSSDIRSMAARGTDVGGSGSSTPKPAAPVNKATGSKKPGSVYSSFDMFDVVKGHIIDEGYAETEEAAIAIMANMSEEWKASIIEEVLDEGMTSYEKNRRRAAQRAAARNAARDAGQTGAVKGVGYVTSRRERETWTDEKGKTRHAKGL